MNSLFKSKQGEKEILNLFGEKLKAMNMLVNL